MTLNIRLVLISLVVVLGVSLMVKIDPVTADIGRHIKNGEIILSGNSDDRNALLTTNYYSYTEGESSFINHHWLSGVIFFIVFKFLGFSGLSILYIAGILTAFWLMLDLVRKKISPIILGSVALIAIPIIASRAEVRPEVFTFLLTALFIWICSKYTEGKLSAKWLWFLPPLQILWVNLHIGFVFGLFIICAYLIGSIAGKNYIDSTRFVVVLLATCIASLINPSHIYGVLYPFQIFDIYTYRVFENQSIGFLSNLGVGNVFTFAAYKTLVGLVLVSYALAAIKDWKKISVPILIIAPVFGYMGLSAIRDFPTFALVGLLALGANTVIIFEGDDKRLRLIKNETLLMLACAILILSGAVFNVGLSASRSQNFGIGAESNINAAAEFFKKNNLKGPIFNNYDIGGYLIYNLFPAEKVYFDNRPEAYSKKFVNEEYIKALENPEVFNEIDKKYKFNAIFYYYRDYTPWGQTFITNKVFDPSWTPVYADKSIIILLKRNDENMPVIKKYEMSRDSFRIIK